jgi:hypothetical protein
MVSCSTTTHISYASRNRQRNRPSLGVNPARHMGWLPMICDGRVTWVMAATSGVARPAAGCCASGGRLR